MYISALSEKNDSIRHSIYNKMDEIIIENSVIVPLYYDRVLCFLQKNMLAKNGVGLIGVVFLWSVFLM